MRTDSLSEFIFREIKEMALGYGKLHILMPFYIEELSRHQGLLMPFLDFIYLLFISSQTSRFCSCRYHS